MEKRSIGTTTRGRAPLLLVLLFALAPLPALAQAPTVYGLELVPWSKKLEEDRYQSSRDWEGTLRYFREKLRGWKGVRWHREVNLPTVKYVHIQNTNPKAKWSGINIYELPGGRVRMYVLKRITPKAEPKAAERADDAAQPAFR